MSVDLLLITWNRRHYLEKTIECLLSDPTEFNLYCWDNGSEDGTQDIIANLDDPRVVERHMSRENVGQAPACFWFFERAQSDLIGKIDDDILLPEGWITQIAPMLRRHPEFGLLAGWVFQKEEWDEEAAAHNIVSVGEYRVLRRMGVQGHSFLGRREYVTKYAVKPKGHGLPVDQTQMSLDGLINGYPLPIIFLHNMDDPRSPYFAYADAEGITGQAPLTARKHGFKDYDEYAAWIAADAKNTLEYPFELRLKKARIRREKSLKGIVKRKLLRYFPSSLPYL